ncbi:hypothetical protein ACEQPO_23630 [Bacillus sp. SL00103]
MINPFFVFFSSIRSCFLDARTIRRKQINANIKKITVVIAAGMYSFYLQENTVEKSAMKRQHSPFPFARLLHYIG